MTIRLKSSSKFYKIYSISTKNSSFKILEMRWNLKKENTIHQS